MKKTHSAWFPGVSAQAPKKRFSINFLLAALALYLAVLSGTTAWTYTRARTAVLRHIDQRLLASVASVPHLLAPDFHDRATESGAISEEEDARNIAVLTDVARRGGFAFLFTLVRCEGVPYLTSSSASEEELAEGTEVRYFTAYEEVTDIVNRSLASPAPAYKSYADRWGSFRGVYRQAISPGGVPYVAAAEVSLAEVHQALRSVLMNSIGVALLLLVATLPMLASLLRAERRNARALAATNEELRREIVEREQVQAQLIEAQRMESLGKLAGGVAHDFNNLLATILGFAELAREQLGPHEPAKRDLAQIEAAAVRGRDLVQQILAFAKGPQTAVRPVRIAAVVREVLARLESIRPPGIQLVERLEADGFVRAAPVNLDQLLMNLCTNAAQAMEPRGGMLTVALTLDATPDINGVRNIVLTVSDTGCGIPAHILPTIFEPYFTTKEVGKGSGLGLAVVHGIVKGMGGTIQVQSKEQQGTVFTIRLPVCAEPAPNPRRPSPPRAQPRPWFRRATASAYWLWMMNPPWAKRRSGCSTGSVIRRRPARTRAR